MLETLHEVELLRGLQQDELALLDRLFEPYRCPAGTVIFEQGEKAEYLYLLVEGEVVIRYKPYDGPPITVARIAPGGAFGWSAAVGSATYTSCAVCEKDCRAVRIRGDDLRRLCEQHPRLGRVILDRLAEVVSSRWQNARTQVRAMLAYGVREKQETRQVTGERAMKTTAPQHSKEEKLRGLIEQLSAYVEQFHGGSVEFISFDGKVLKVRLGGACLGCPLSPATLRGWVAGTVRQFFPEVEVVEAGQES